MAQADAIGRPVRLADFLHTWYHTTMDSDITPPRSAPPKPRRASGRFLLRIDPGLHASLREAARAADASLNEYCARKLASPRSPMHPEAAAVVARASSLLGTSLIGVVAFGSWARGEAVSSSDLDVLLVADSSAPIERSLYRRWDELPPLGWDGHRVAPHFVHGPDGATPVSALWAEVATDGLVLFERGIELSRRLARVRRRILRGEISPRSGGGRRYWVRERMGGAR